VLYIWFKTIFINFTWNLLQKNYLVQCNVPFVQSMKSLCFICTKISFFL